MYCSQEKELYSNKKQKKIAPSVVDARGAVRRRQGEASNVLWLDDARAAAGPTAMRAEVARLTAKLAAAEARVEELTALADRDPLLGLMNRRAFLREATRTLAEVRRHGLDAHVAYLDLDGLKPVNDTHGHAGGDALLAHFGRTLENLIREGDTLARLGGDEFGLLLPHTDPANADAAMHRLCRAAADRPLRWQGEAIALRFSWGLVPLSAHDDAETLLQRADEAMYRDKQARRAAGLAAIRA